MNIDELYRQAREDGVRLLDNLPFYHRPPQARDAGVLLVHGFTATPWELRGVANCLNQEGFTTLGIRLPGHGTTLEDLAGAKLEDWQQEVGRGLESLAAECTRVYGVGVSTGSLLLLPPAAAGKLAGLVLISPFLTMAHPLAPYAGLLRYLVPFQKRSADEQSPYYSPARPLAGIQQINHLLRLIRPLLPEVACPVLALSADGDQTIDPQSAQQLYDELGSPAKQLQRYGPDAPHVLCTPDYPDFIEVLERIRDYLVTLEGPVQASEAAP